MQNQTIPNKAYPVKALTKSQNQTHQPNFFSFFLQKNATKNTQIMQRKRHEKSQEECELAKNKNLSRKKAKGATQMAAKMCRYVMSAKMKVPSLSITLESNCIPVTNICTINMANTSCDHLNHFFTKPISMPVS